MHEIIRSLPAVNAGLNFITVILIIAGYIQVRKKNRRAHQQLMTGAAVVSAVFLVSYVIKTIYLGTTVYGGTGFIRTVYYSILFSHLTLAMAIIPLIVITLFQGFTRRLRKHRRLGRWVIPLWLYVSITGITVHLFLRPWY